MLEEQWVAVPGFPKYEVSNYGRIENIQSGRELKPHPDKKTGVLRIALYRGPGDRKDVYVDRVVAEAFFLNYIPGMKVYHLNGDQDDCSVLNLTIDWREAVAQDISRHAEDYRFTLHAMTAEEMRYILKRSRQIREDRYFEWKNIDTSSRS